MKNHFITWKNTVSDCCNLFHLLTSLPTKSFWEVFSQGAILALNAALRMTPPPRALILMSGSFFPSKILNKDKQTFSTGGRFFQCHGKADPLLSYSESKDVHSFLQALQWKGEFVSFEGGHEIPHAVLLQIQEFISHTLS